MGHSSTDVASRLVYLLSELAESTLDANEATRPRVHSRSWPLMTSDDI